MTTIQEANVAHLRAIDPERIYVHAMDLPCRQNCANDYLHGKGVVLIWPYGGADADPLCLACAIPVAEGWLVSDACDHLVISVER
jgi:hypothetical protein